MIQQIEMIDIVKQYPLVRAVNHVSFTIQARQIHSLLGENGAGKTCLMKILYGMTHPDQGAILINGEKVTIKSPKDSIALGIGMVHQHFMLSPVMSVTENIIVNMEPKTKMGFIDYEKARFEVQTLIDTYNFNINADELVENLSVGEQQRVEILKALYRGAHILILDEPTAVLTPQEVEELFIIMRALKEKGTGIVIITHKLKETLAIADVISVLRDGECIRHALPLGNVTAVELANMMVGREVELHITSRDETREEEYFFIKNLSYFNKKVELLKNINITICKGEILGIAGVEGNGQTELIEVLTGLTTPDSLELYKGETPITGDASSFIEHKIGHIPEDRLTRGLITEMSIEENIILGYHNKDEFTKKGFLRKSSITNFANNAIKNYAIKTPSSKEKASSLSGGNQQKIIVARVIEQNPDVLIVAQPTRGVDVGAMEYIHHQLLKLKRERKAILLISADLDEVYNLSDRIAVMYNGEIVKVLHKHETNQKELGLLMAGGK